MRSAARRKGDGEPKKTKGEVRWIIGSRDYKANPLRTDAPARTGTNRCHSPLTYPNPTQKTETSSTTLLFLFACSLPTLRIPLLLSLLLTLSLSLRAFASFLSVSRSPLLFFSTLLSSSYYPSFSSPLYHRQSSCNVPLVFLRYSRRGATRRRDGMAVR